MSFPDRSQAIVVVGAGIIGASIAFRLASRGAQVTVLDAGEPGHGASVVSFAWINARDKNPRAYHDLNRRSVDIWDRFARELGIDVGLQWGGELRWTATEEGAATMRERVRTLQRWGYRIELLKETKVHALEPDLITGPIAAASYSTVDGHVNTALVVAACLERARAFGADVRTQTPVVGFEMEEHAEKRRIAAVRTADGAFACDQTVLAVGPDSPAVAELAGVQLPVHHTFGATIITTPVAPLLRRVAVVQTATDAAPQVAFRQFADGRVMIHGGDGATESGSMGRTEEEVAKLFAAAKRFVPALRDAEVAEVRRGRRPIPDDGHPVLGFTSGVPNLYLATMHSGVTLSALVGELAAQEIIDGVRVDLLELYRVARFAGG